MSTIFSSLAGARAHRRTFQRGAAFALGLLFAMGASATSQVSSLVPTPDILPARGTVTNIVTIADSDSLPIGAPGASFTFTIPANTTYLGTGTLPGGATCSADIAVNTDGPGTVTCSNITLAANELQDFPILFQTHVQGTLNVSAAVTGPGAGASKTITVNEGADVGLTISAPASAPSGGTVPISFTITNNGPDATTGTGSILSYPIPSGLTVSGSGLPAGCLIGGGNLTCNVGALGVGANRVITVNGTVTAGSGSTIGHAASVAAGAVGDGVATNNSASGTTTVTPGSALALTKTHDGGQLVVGQSFNFTLRPSFSGSPPVGVTLTDTLPGNFTINGAINAAPGWSCTPSGQTVNCTRTDIGGMGGAGVTLGNIVIPVTAVSAGTGVVNSATLAATGPVAGSVPASVPADVAAPATDFKADKRRSWPQNNVPLNQDFDYQIGSTNLGPTRLLAGSHLQLTDDIPAGIQVNGFTNRDGYTCVVRQGATPVTVFPVAGPVQVTCDRTTAADIGVDAGGGARNGGFILVNARITTTAGAPFTNHMCVNAALPAAAPTNGADPDAVTGNDCQDLGTGVDAAGTAADVIVRKSVNGIGNSAANRQTAGLPVEWDIEIINRGPSTASNVAVTDSFVQAVTGSVNIVGQSAGPGVDFPACGLAVDGTTASLAGCSVTTLPVCKALDGSGSGPACPVIKVMASHFGDGASAADNSFSINNKVSALAATPADPVLDDAAGQTNSATAIAYYTAKTDVTVTKTADTSPVPAGQLLTYTLTAITNDLPVSYSRAYTVTLTDTLPPNLVFLSATPQGGGSCSTQPNTAVPTGAGNNQLVCSWPSIDRGTQQTMQVKVRPLVSLFLGSASITNNVTVSTVTPETNAANNTASVAVPVGPPTYDLVVTKHDDKDPADVGDNVDYTITLSNNQASTAENVQVVDTLPTVGTVAGELPPTLVSVTTAAGNPAPVLGGGAAIGSAGGTITFNVPVLGGGGSGSGRTGEPAALLFHVVLKAQGKGTFTNNVKTSFVDPAVDVLETQKANNVVDENTTFRYKADVTVVSKQAVATGTATPLTTVAANQSFDWLVQVKNNGPQSADTTTFTDTLPTGLVLAAAPTFAVTSGTFVPAAPTCTGAVGGTAVSCAIDAMPNLGTATVRIPVRFSGAAPANGTVVTNRAHIVTTGSGDGNGLIDPNGGNNFNDGSVTVQTSGVAGRVYEDLDGDGVWDAGEPGIAGVSMHLTGKDSLNNDVDMTVSTDGNGLWSFSAPAGTYTVTEAQPAAYQPGITRAGTVTGGGSTPGTVPTTGGGVTSGPNGSNANLVQNIVLGAGGSSVANNFGEVRLASIAGRVYADADYNGASSAGDPGIAGVAVALTGTDMFGNAVTLPAASTAAASGNYSFPNLLPGSYTLTETQPANFADGPETAGSAGGSVSTNDQIATIALASNAASTGNNFGELLTRIPVRVFVDTNDDGTLQGGETGIAGVTLVLTGTDAAGNPVSIAATPTGPAGSYEFRDVPPSGAGGYTITETQPAGFAPGKNNANGHPGTVQPGGNLITGVTVAGPNPPLTQGSYDFGELVPSGISGRVYYDRDGSGLQNGAEPGLAGVTIALSGTDTHGVPVTASTTTDASGNYSFLNLAPGSYSVTETRPAGYQPGITRAGATTGAGSAPGTVPTAGTGVANGPNGSNANLIQAIVLGSTGAGSTANNFSAVKPASLAGYVYADVLPANGTRDAAEPGLGGTTVTVSGTDFQGNAVSRPVQTAADGHYVVDNLLPGSYQIDETQPSGVADGPESLGTVGGAARGAVNPAGANDRFNGLALVSEDVGIDYNFGERGGQVAGWVYVDGSKDGLRQPGEPGIAGVTVTLTGRTAGGTPVNLSTVTAADGRYTFLGLLPADADGYTIRETQPVTYADGLDAVGTLDGSPSGSLGNDVLGAVAYHGGNGDNYNFGEHGASLAGTVYNDANGNGTREPQDLPIAGVTVTLTGNDASGQPVTRTAVTGPDGKYLLPNLPMPDGGGYTVTETQPSGYGEGTAKAGTLGGAVQGTNQIHVGFNTPGTDGTGYDFNERNSQPASLEGRVWFDQSHNRLHEGSEGGGEGWTVMLMQCPDGGNGCPETALVPLYSVSTAADGSYRFGDLVPGEYRVRFRSPDGRTVGGVWPTDPASNAAGAVYPTPPASDPRFSIRARVAAGAHLVQQDLPYDPGGVVYDSISGSPVPGAVVTLVGPSGFDPARDLLDGRDSYTTPASGTYDFFLLPSAPPGEYRLTITPPGSYLPSTLYPAVTGDLATQACSAPPGGVAPAQNNPCVVSPGAALVTGAGYYLSFQMPPGGGLHVVANNIPLDPASSTLIELRKTTSKLTVKKAELLPYRITARNTRGTAVAGVAVVDTLPPGFRYVQNSLTVRTLPTGVALPVLSQTVGRQVIIPAQNFAPNEIKEYLMVAGVGTGVGEGEYVNQVIATQGVGGRALSNLASAAVRVVPDALFDCTDVIGKVYDDKNANAYQDEGEPGIANVRIATVNGVLVTTDAEGRYHIACAAVPKDGTGSNLVLKLDERTLPSGYRTTSENPAAERATRGKVLKVNFGATVHRVVRLALQASAFEAGAAALKAGYAAQIAQAVDALAEKPSVLRLAYRAAAGDPDTLGRDRAAAVKADVLARWKQFGEQRAAKDEAPLFNLDVEVELLPASTTP